MNIVKSNWFCSLLIFIVGMILCCWYGHDDVLKDIIYILGALFTATGCINIVTSSIRYSQGTTGAVSTTVGWLAGLGGIGLGAAMLLVPHSFTGILVYVFAILLVLGGLWHFFILAYSLRKYSMPGWLYFLPLPILIAGVIMFCSTSLREKIPVCILISGIGAILFGLISLTEFIVASVNARKMNRHGTMLQSETTKSAETIPQEVRDDERSEEKPVVSNDATTGA